MDTFDLVTGPVEVAGGLEEIPCDVVVVGAGPAGLATGAALRRIGIEPVLIERGEAIGWSWRHHYERLRLHTVKEHSALPGLPFPDETSRYPTRRDVVDYLEGYARHFGLGICLGEEVRRVRRVEQGWRIDTSRSAYLARHVVIATGYNREPFVPTWPDQDRFRGAIGHSHRYRSGAAYSGRSVLVVGIGNTGAEIALDLAEHGAQPAISVRSPVVVMPREFRGRPTQVSGIWLSRAHVPAAIRDWLGRAMSRLAFGDLSRYGLTRANYGPVTLIERYGRLPVIDIGTMSAIEAGRIDIVPDVTRFTSNGVVFSDGQERQVDDVILATGYRPGLGSFLEGADDALDPRGYPVRETGDVPGLHFVGFARPKAGMLREIALSAPRVARAVSRDRSATRR